MYIIMEIKKRGRPRSRDTIFLECPICRTSKIKSLEEYKLKGSVKWETNIKPKYKPTINQGLNSKNKITQPQPQIIEKRSLIIDLMN
jgi:hypothetical protein